MNPIERGLRRLDAFQQRHTVIGFLFGVAKKYGDDNGGNLVANIAYSGFITVFPLLLILVTVLGLVMAGDPGARNTVLHSAYAKFPVVGSQLQTNIHTLRRSSTVGLIIGLLVLLWGSRGVAQSGLFAMSEVWNVPGAVRPNYWSRLARTLGFLAVMGLGLVVSSFLAGFSTFGRHEVGLGYLFLVLGGLVNVGQFLLAFRVLTPKQVGLRCLIPGSVVGGIGWTILQAVGSYLVGHELKGASATYGAFAAVLGLLFWIYLGAQLAVYSAELNVVLLEHMWPRSIIQPPLTAADQESLARQATQNQRRPEQHVEVSFSQEPMSQDQYLDREGSDREGSDREGSDREGSDREGSDREGSDREQGADPSPPDDDRQRDAPVGRTQP